MDPAVTAIIVSYASPEATAEAAHSALAQSLPPSEVLVVDNGERRATLTVGVPAEAHILHPRTNLGYTGAVNLAASEANGEWLFLLNPDAVAASDCLARLLESVDGPDVAIVGAQVLLPDGRVNAGANPTNIAGISWSGSYGAPRERGAPRDTASVSGAALLVRRDRFIDAGGLCPFFFMYVDDTDLAWRLRIAGARVRFNPEAIVVHDYAFDKGARKWFYLERNRMWALLSNLQPRTLALLAPVLVATEAAIVVRAAREGWLKEKLRAWCSLLRRPAALIRWRRAVQATRAVSDRQILAMFVGGVDSELLETAPPAWVNSSLERYRRLVMRLLGSPEQ